MKKGFSFIELLVLIAIAGILVCVVLVGYNDAKNKIPQTEAEYCAEQADFSMRWLPAKCIKYYLPSDQTK